MARTESGGQREARPEQNVLTNRNVVLAKYLSRRERDCRARPELGEPFGRFAIGGDSGEVEESTPHSRDQVRAIGHGRIVVGAETSCPYPGCMRANILLCDHAQVADGKLFIHGAGISQVGAASPTALGILLYVPWNDTNREISYELTLLTQDGYSTLWTLDGESAEIRIGGTFEVGRPPGVRPGTPLEVCLAHNFAPFQGLQRGRYQWQLTIDSVNNSDWNVAFDLNP